MITDNPKDMELKLTNYIQEARMALETLETINPHGLKEHDPAYEQYIQALNRLNTARVWLSTAAEQLHDLVNVYNDNLAYAGYKKRHPDPEEPFPFSFDDKDEKIAELKEFNALLQTEILVKIDEFTRFGERHGVDLMAQLAAYKPKKKQRRIV